MVGDVFRQVNELAFLVCGNGPNNIALPEVGLRQTGVLCVYDENRWR